MNTHSIIAAALLSLAPALVHAQSLDARVAAAQGSVGFEFETRANVCGNGTSINVSDDTSAGWTMRPYRSGVHMGRRSGDGSFACEMGPARVVLQHSGAAVNVVSVTVGGRAVRADNELGAIPPAEAAHYLLAVAPRLSGRSGDDAVMGAAIADIPSPWRRMLEIARSRDASESSRNSSLFWVSQEASAVATAGLADVAMDDANESSVRSSALFFLAQRTNGEGIPSLVRVVRESKSAKLRKDAIFHLAQSRDPRALALFEQLLAG
ncbi:MAG: hypothetical protein ABIP93_03820, partial [Gemmatimonadaceae bacterium]